MGKIAQPIPRKFPIKTFGGFVSKNGSFLGPFRGHGKNVFSSTLLYRLHYGYLKSDFLLPMLLTLELCS